jgi:hypothetical protein
MEHKYPQLLLTEEDSQCPELIPRATNSAASVQLDISRFDPDPDGTVVVLVGNQIRMYW